MGFGSYVPPPPAAAAPQPSYDMASAPAPPPVNIFNPAAAAPDQVTPPGPPLMGGGAPGSMAPPSMGMGIGAGTGVIGGDVAAANERKLMYAQGMTAYEPPKSDGAGQSHKTLILL